MEKSPFGSRKREVNEADQFNLREWDLKARISRDNTLSRRFSASHIRSFRADPPSFRSNFTVSSTASSPGYHLRDEIDLSTYSFTNALKALQARSINTWECLSPDKFALNSKWNEAEKYISNPFSGEVPMECLSSKTLSGRSFRGLTSRMTMSAPLIYPSHSRLFHTATVPTPQDKLPNNVPIQEEKKVGNYMKTRDVGTQSRLTEISSSNPSPASTPPIQERSIKCNLIQSADSTNSSSKSKSEEEIEVIKEGMRRKEEDKEEMKREEEKDGKKSKCYGCRFRQGGGGCLSLINLWRRKTRQRQEHKQNPKNIFLCHINGSCESYI